MRVAYHAAGAFRHFEKGRGRAGFPLGWGLLFIPFRHFGKGAGEPGAAEWPEDSKNGAPGRGAESIFGVGRKKRPGLPAPKQRKSPAEHRMDRKKSKTIDKRQSTKLFMAFHRRKGALQKCGSEEQST